MEFEWDPRKAVANLKLHGITFEEAQMAFYDPNAVEILDDAHSVEEIRYLILAFSPKRLLFIGYTVRENDVIRIITARKATTYERRFYDEEQRKR